MGNGNGNGGAAGARDDGPRGRAVYAASGSGYGGPPMQAPPAQVSAPEHDQEGMTLRDYLGVLWRRKWVILLVVVVATASAYFFSARQAKQYEAKADLIYEQQLDVSNPLTGQSYTDTNERNLELRSVGSIIASPDMKQRAAAELQQHGQPGAGFKVTAAPVSDSTTGSTSGDSNVVRITATSGDPALAAAAANAFASEFVSYRKENVEVQIQRAIDAVKAKLDTYEGGARQSTDYLVLQQRLQDLQLLKATATGNYRVLIPATVPTSPAAPNPLRSALLGLGVGLFAGIGLAFLLEQFDTRLRRPDEIAAILQQPILGRVPHISRKNLGEDALVTLRHPDGQVAESFRMVRTNLDFMAVDAEVHSMVLTSCQQGEGKSVAVANLAVSLALAGKKIIVVDADLRRPRLHTYFGLSNERGLSTVATGRDELLAAVQPVAVEPTVKGAPSDFRTWATGTDARSRLYVLTSGPIPPNPGEIVASRRFEAILDELAGECDLLLIDSPAMLAVGDTSAIAAKVDGLVFLVDMQAVKRPQLQTAADQLHRLPVRKMGCVVRMEGIKGGRYFYSTPYYYGYSEDGSRTRERRRLVPGRRAEDSTPV
jgi:Mrp family chromosome partitioning ATPase/capsular polysaccharide biosynthesis protein